MKIKIGFLVSYDYEFLKNSLPPIYELADEIYLAIDRNRNTWNGAKYVIEPAFFEWISNFDIMKKIKIYEDVFYISTLSTMEIDTRERNMLAQYMGKGGWHLQIDADEYFCDFKNFVNQLRKLEQKATKYSLEIRARWINLYKITPKGFLYIDDSKSYFSVATNNPVYEIARSQKCQKQILIKSDVIHQSWARPNYEMYLKIKNWSHNNDFNTESYYKLWHSIDDNNYRYIKDFHPLGNGKFWKSLNFLPGKNLEEILMGLNSGKIKIEFSKLNIKDFIPPILITVLKKILKL